MAKYTELLSEYLEHGGELPAVFGNIEGFEDLFKGKYCDREIGFETPVLFQIKLEARANLVIPAYVKRIAEYEEAEKLLTKAEKTRVKSGAISYSGKDTHIFETNDHVREQADLPFSGNVLQMPPTYVETDKGYKDTDTIEKGTKESYDNVKEVESGYTPTEATSVFKALEDKVYNILQECLEEFESLFMEIY